MFKFIVKYLGFLKSVPLIAHAFDGHLKIWMLVTGSDIPDCLDDIEAEISKWDGITISLHKYGGIQFNFNGKEIGHIHSNGILDIRFDRKTKQQLVSEGKATHHHIFHKSGWVSFYIKGKEDYPYAINLLRMSYLKAGSQNDQE